MRLLQRNLKPFYYCLFTGSQKLLDERGFEVGTIVTYGEPVTVKGNVSASQGQAQVEIFGTSDLYSKVIILSDTECPIDENTVLFVDKEPEFSEVSSFTKDPDTGDIVPVEYQVALFDYVVKRVAKSLNSVSYAIDKVEVR